MEIREVLTKRLNIYTLQYHLWIPDGPPADDVMFIVANVELHHEMDIEKN